MSGLNNLFAKETGVKTSVVRIHHSPLKLLSMNLIMLVYIVLIMFALWFRTRRAMIIGVSIMSLGNIITVVYYLYNGISEFALLYLVFLSLLNLIIVILIRRKL